MVFSPLDDVELVDWATTNKFARLWLCEDIHHSSILKQAIKKAIQKSNNWNLSHQRFEKHSVLESTLEILQQFYIQVETQYDEFHLFVGNLSTYTLWCKRCGQRVTLHGLIGEILYHAPAAMLYHWKIIEPHDERIHRELMLMPLLFASSDNYV